MAYQRKVFGASMLLLVAGAAQASTIVVDHFEAPSSSATPNTWYQSDIRGAGTADTVDLSGAGGNLEAGQPSGPGAAEVTTGSNNADKAEVATYNNFGSVADVLSSWNFSYDYYKASGAGDAAAAPSLKLNLYNSNCGSGDCYGSLVYEPYWNQGTGGAGTVPADAWQNVNVTTDTGSGSDQSGGWWWSGGFGQSNSAGGPPLQSLSEWLAHFKSSDPADIDGASVVGIALGIGTYNPDTTGYFDNVSYTDGSGNTTTFDFQPARANAVPEPSALLMLLGGVLLVGTGAAVRRRRLG
ncbi:MAG: PEP-CTERM sorting domain-containing protein [Salinisphaera sp.]|uniref:PEP-CTERM sorting domain-containing protein n=1 Tax=Salinisphaera sp. TaxID=1914330 RepID=UPI003C7D7104